MDCGSRRLFNVFSMSGLGGASLSLTFAWILRCGLPALLMPYLFFLLLGLRIRYSDLHKAVSARLEQAGGLIFYKS